MNWFASLDWRDVVTIVSLLVTLVSLFVAIRSHSRMKTAREAEKSARQKLLNRLAAENFGDMARAALDLAAIVRSADWKRTADHSTALRGNLSQALGAWSKILDPSEMDRLQVASTTIRALIELIPGTGENIEQPRQQQILSQCDFVIEVVYEVAGRLKYYEEEPQENL